MHTKLSANRFVILGCRLSKMVLDQARDAIGRLLTEAGLRLGN